MIVKIIDSKGRKFDLEVNKSDTIKKVKENFFLKAKNSIYSNEYYSIKRIGLTFNGEDLNDDETIEELGIDDGDLIYWSVLYNGGEVGSAVKMMTDPEKKGPVKWKTTYYGPDYRIVKKGINLFGFCQNKNCIAYKKEVCHPFGLGTFDLIQDLSSKSDKCPKCPACEYLLLELETCGFMKCKYHYYGKKIENDQIKKLDYSNSISEEHVIDYFEAGKNDENKSFFYELKISASNL